VVLASKNWRFLAVFLGKNLYDLEKRFSCRQQHYFDHPRKNFMLRKIFIFFLAIITIGQVVISVAAMSWLSSTIDVEEVDYLDSSISVKNFLVADQNQLWISSYDDSIYLYQNRQLARKFTSDEIGTITGKLILSPQGDIWNIAYTTSSGVSVYDGQSWNFIDGSKEVAYDATYDAVVDRQGRLWLATATTIYLYENNEWKQFNTSNSNIISDGAMVMALDANDHIWVGTDKGVTYFDGQNWQVPAGSPGVNVRSLAFAQNGDVWVGSLSDGLFRFDGTTWTRYPVEQDRKNPERFEAVEKILVDKYGRAWVKVTTEIFYIFDGQSNKYLGEGPTYTVTDMLIAPDGLVYMGDSVKFYAVSQDTRLLTEFEHVVKNLYDDGFIVFTTLLLTCIWVITALQAWGIGAGIALGLLTYIVFAIFSIHGYLNPGCATTLIAFVGGMFGYFRQDLKVKQPMVIGSLAGYFSSAILIMCCVGAAVIIFIPFMGR
jgi:hypothetical protein